MNVTGRCDKVYFDTSLYNSSKHRALLVGYHNPLLLRLNQSLDVQAFRSFHNFDHESAYHEFLTGVLVKHVRGAHQLQYECAWREVMLVRNATLAQFGDAGHTLKSSLRHQLLLDARDSSLLPTRGGAVSLAHEIAGLGGNVQFLKHESAVQLNWALLPSLSFGVLARGGAIFASQSHTNRLSPTDRFYLGGPTSFAGFARRGVGGGSTRRSQLGGSAYWSVLSMLSCPLQAFFTKDLGDSVSARVHCFAQTGALAQPRAGEWHALNGDLLSNYRTSVGFGIGLSIGTGMESLFFVCEIAQCIDRVPSLFSAARL
jgi:outer membrane protein insertion porin family